uniref:Uncharacterized protein n=1 Tax=Moniliophthora roreri TaxID=221103 RepID=A0A0W0FYZ7_MONRR
MSGRSLLLLY